MIDKELRLVLDKVYETGQAYEENIWGSDKYDKFIDTQISQIKALVVESLGEEEEFDHTKSDFVSNNHDALYGYNQHIAEMKSIWGGK